ncbi:MAG: D-alanyl-D-alanine carboxypeptidase/D-alanyl-D-alanine endopeptidase [Burkholderiaceae bacterium]
MLQALRQAGIPADAAGIYVGEVDGGRPLIEANAAQPLNPASTMKLVTSEAALDLLGPAYAWTTRAYAAGPLVDGVLDGDLVIQGGGDPKLVLESFWLFLRELREKGVREIRGDLVLDRSLFAPAPHDATAFDGDPTRPYNAGPDALLLNYRSVRLHFLPDPAARTVRVAVDPPMAGYPVAAPVLAGGPCSDWREKIGLDMDDAGIRFGGGYPASCGEKTWYVHVWRSSTAAYVGAVFRRMWSDLGGRLDGAVRDGALPPGATLLVEHLSPPLPEVLRDINNFSNNVMARQLLLTIAADVLKQPATEESGARLVRTWLAGKGIEAPELVIDNGAGLSRAARISAATLGRLLMAAWRSPTMPEFVSSLPLVGYDGTMRQRLKNSDAAGRGHVKTGSLEGVRAIAGYVEAVSGRRYAVVFLVNHPDAARAQAAQDALLRWVVEEG